VVDKHSTGGVGDNVSLMLAPIAAACGLAVPMISGRGLGHTGGTLDKMEAIPGYTAMPDNALFRKVVDVRLRDHRPDRQSGASRQAVLRHPRRHRDGRIIVPLITASILSKNLPPGSARWCSTSNAAMAPSWTIRTGANELARSLVEVATGAGMPTTALITDMNQPLASAAGNAVEVPQRF
jgi:thymidine phosphorylase